MSPILHELTARVTRLSDTLMAFKHRVREAVAGETANAIAHTVRDILIDIFRGRFPIPTQPPNPWPSRRDYDSGYRVRNEYEPDPWDNDDWSEADPRSGNRVVQPTPEPESNRWWTALKLTHLAISTWLHSQISGRVAVLVGAAMGAAALVGNPLMQCGLALVALIADLLP